MSLNITLTAVCSATITAKDGRNKNRFFEEKIHLWQTPTNVTVAIMECSTHEERLAVYEKWALLNGTIHEVTKWSEEDPTIRLEFHEETMKQIVTGDTVTIEEKTMSEIHIQNLHETIAKYKDEGWDFEWSYE